MDALDPSVYLQDINFPEEGTNVELDGTLERIDRFMSDLVPEDMLAVELPPGEEQTFYMYVDQSPSKIKVAFTVQADRNVDQNADQSLTPIDFKVAQYLSHYLCSFSWGKTKKSFMNRVKTSFSTSSTSIHLPNISATELPS